ncbi:hypothetical protein HB780_15655 [Rhizobium lusitanum]|uniref:hypothetical protein n=1 Tax=Rhizobium lusitanum TaxID=293958 RepID=UPI00161D8991|nr:hypothetical protein [Rhizobium lusitanum]QND47157.1 hypothetical protein HB780_15655 [Rhizobium lusitanum]
MIKLDLGGDISFLPEHVSVDIHEKNLAKIAATFTLLLINKDEQAVFTNNSRSVAITHGGKKSSSAEKQGEVFRYRPDERMLKTIVGILSDIVLGGKFDANHIDFDLQTQTGSFGFTLRFDERFYEVRLPWER